MSSRTLKTLAGTLQPVAEGIYRIEDSFVNWYLIEEDGEITIVDAGLPTSWRLLQIALAELGRILGDIKAILLTHAHFDHVGFAERARRELGIPIWVHLFDAPLARHPLSYRSERSPLIYLWRPAALKIVGSMAIHGALTAPGIKEVRTFGASDQLAVPGAPQVLFCPGHTDGHCAFHFPNRNAIIVGDALVMLDPYTGLRGPRLVARAATADSSRARQSLLKLIEADADIVLTGHGEPWTRGIREAVEIAQNRRCI